MSENDVHIVRLKTFERLLCALNDAAERLRSCLARGCQAKLTACARGRHCWDQDGNPRISEEMPISTGRQKTRKSVTLVVKMISLIMDCQHRPRKDAASDSRPSHVEFLEHTAPEQSSEHRQSTSTIESAHLNFRFPLCYDDMSCMLDS